MKLRILSTLLLAGSLSFAATAATNAPATAATATPPSSWKIRIDSLFLQAKDLTAAQTLAQARVRQERLQYLAKEDPESPEYAVQWKACSLYVAIAEAQLAAARLRQHGDSLAQARIAVQKDIVAIQKQILEIEAGKSSSLAADLEAEKQRLARNSAASADEQERLKREAAERERKLQADAAEREKKLQSELAEKQRLLEEERRKAEERQADARKKLDALQSKLINVHKDARGIILSMSDILFDVNKATLTPDLKTSLAKIAGILTVYSESNIIVEGHTDNTGSVELNQKLSEQRAGNVRQFMVEQGIAGARLKSEGFGFSRPIGDNSTSEGRQKNRRVDLVIQDKTLQ
jgi:outer membrane protein OmpA-like peptidoglycan-associated protein